MRYFLLWKIKVIMIPICWFLESLTHEKLILYTKKKKLSSCHGEKQSISVLKMTKWSMLFWNNNVLGTFAAFALTVSVTGGVVPQVGKSLLRSQELCLICFPLCNPRGITWSLLLFIYYCVSVPSHRITGQKYNSWWRIFAPVTSSLPFLLGFSMLLHLPT